VADYTATGGGNAAYNGDYTQNGTFNSEPAYENANGRWLFWADTAINDGWVLCPTKNNSMDNAEYTCYASAGITGAWNVGSGSACEEECDPAPTVAAAGGGGLALAGTLTLAGGGSAAGTIIAVVYALAGILTSTGSGSAAGTVVSPLAATLTVIGGGSAEGTVEVVGLVLAGTLAASGGGSAAGTAESAGYALSGALAIAGGGTVAGEVSSPTWVEHMLGTVAHSCSRGIFKITDDTPAEYLYYTIDLSQLDNTVGTLTDVRIRIDAASSGRNQGACLSISDGTYQFIVWLRTGTLNIDGEPKVGVKLTGWHRLQFYTRGTDCEVFIDGVSIQTGMRMDMTAAKQVAFGSWVPSPHVSRTPGLSVCEWDWTRTKGLEDYLTVEEFEMALNSISIDLKLFDFKVGDYIIYEYDHQADAVDGVSTALAIFEGADTVWASESDGFLIESQSGGRTKYKYRTMFTFIGTKWVVYDESASPDAYGPDYADKDTYIVETGVSGDGETTLMRIGQLDDEAYL